MSPHFYVAEFADTSVDLFFRVQLVEFFDNLIHYSADYRSAVGIFTKFAFGAIQTEIVFLEIFNFFFNKVVSVAGIPLTTGLKGKSLSS